MKVKTDYTLKVFPIILFAVGIIMTVSYTHLTLPTN